MMPPTQLSFLVATQVMLWLGVSFAMYWTYQCYRDFPTKRWRLMTTMTWLVVGLVASAASTVTIIIGCPTLPVMRIVVWIERTTLLVGYLGVGATSFQVIKFYRGRENDN